MSHLKTVLGRFLAPHRVIASVVGLALAFPLSAALAGDSVPAAVVSQAELANQSSCEYTVQPGDSVYKIATQFGMQPWELQVLNQTRYADIWTGVHVGWVLDVCPEGASAPAGAPAAPPTQAPASAPANPPSGNTLVAYTLDNAKIRANPDKNSPVLLTIPFGTAVTAMGRNATTSWIYVDYTGTRGWIFRSLLEIHGDTFSLPVTDSSGAPGAGSPAVPPTQAPAPPAPTQPPAPAGPVTVTTKGVIRLRACPSTSCREIGRVPGGVTLTPSGRSGDSKWVFVTYTSMKGWMAAWLLTVNGTVSSLPVTNEQGSGGPAAAPVPPSASGGFELGGQTHSFGHPGEMRYAGMNWVKFQHKWTPGQNPADLAGRINDAHAQGFKVLFSIPGPEYPSSIDYNSYVTFVSGVASLGADGIEIWNEMNLDREWPAGQISPSSYVTNMLAPSYRAIKAANPGTLVIAGALAPTGIDNGWSVWSDQRYLAGMRDAGAARYMDCLGVHHNAGATSPDATTGHPADGGDHHYSWYFQPTFNVYAGAFPGSKLCFTELGYVSPEGYGQMPQNFWWGGGNTVGEQSEWLARAVQISRASNRVRLFIVFNVDFTHWGDDPQAGYAIIRPDGGCPACQTLHKVMGGG